MSKKEAHEERETRCADCTDEACGCEEAQERSPDLPAPRPEAPPASSVHKSTSELWNELSATQKRYILAKLKVSSVTEAAELAGISRSVVYTWPDTVSECLERIQEDQLYAAMDVLKNGLLEAVDVKLQGLQSVDERVRQAAASEIIDRYMGRAKQEVDLNHSGKVESTPITVYLPANHRDVSDVTDATILDDEE